jgi:hypothetical protein
MQFPGQGKPPAGVVFDTDMGARIDAALALALLYGFDGKNDVRVAAVSVSRNSLTSAAFTETIGRFYAGAVSAAFGGAMRTLPVGMNDAGSKAEDTPMIAAPLARVTPEGKPVYDHGIHKLNDTADPTAVIRNALSAQYDQNAIVVLAGPATNLVKVLDIPGAKELITRKVRFLAVAAGAYPEGPAESHIKADIPAAKRLFAEWPTPIVAAGQEVGAALLYPGESIENDFSWSGAHPVVDAYRAYQPMPYDAQTWDMTAVLYAARPKEGYFKLSDPGVIRALDDGRVKFTVSAGGPHQYLILDPSQRERIVKTYTEIASAKPVVRQFRFRKKNVQDKPQPQPADGKPQEAKPQEAKP